MKGTGQHRNPNVHIEVIADGQWEDWSPKEPRELVFKVRSPEFDQAISDKIQQIRETHPSDRLTAMVYNSLMGGMLAVAATHKLQNHLSYLLHITCTFWLFENPWAATLKKLLFLKELAVRVAI